MDKFIFPMNYKYSTKFLGIIDYKTILPISIYACIIFLILYLLKIDIFFSFGIFIVLVLPPFLLLSFGINNQPAISYLLAIYKFHKSSNFYLYKKDCKFH